MVQLRGFTCGSFLGESTLSPFNGISLDIGKKKNFPCFWLGMPSWWPRFHLVRLDDFFLSLFFIRITGCFTPIGVYKKLATLNPENIPVNVISIDI
jgi:hypothetical protein